MKKILEKFNMKKVILIIISLSMILPVVLGCFYGLPSADDFSNANGWIAYEGSHFKYVFSNLINLYRGWQGTYFGVFLVGIPIYYIWGYMGLRIWLVVNAVLFMISSYIFVKCALKWFGIKENSVTTLLFFAMGIIFILCNNNLSEIFYWYTGTCVYTLPISCMLLCVSCYIAYEEKNKNKYLVGGCLLAFLAAGGSLDIAALLCATLLFGILYNWFIDKKVKKNIFIGIVALVGAIINTVAPGNFVRHSAIDTKIRPFRSAFDLIIRINEIISSEIKLGFLLLIIIVAFLWACNHFENSSKKFKYPGLVTLYAYSAIFITDFPVALGYSNGYDMPDRCAFVETLAIVVFAILSAAYWGGWCAQKKVFHFTPEIYFVIAIICTIPLSYYLNLSAVKELIPYKMMWHIAKGDYEKVSAREENIIRQIEEAQDEDVVVYSFKEGEGEWTNLQKIGINSDPTFWVNRAVAGYYNVNTISLQYNDEQ